MRRIIICLFLLLTAFSCQKHLDSETKRAFYYWKQQYLLTNDDISTLEQLRTRRLYIRYFDLVRENGKLAITPPLTVNSNSRRPGFEIIPTVFITAEVFKGLNAEYIPGVAKQLVEAIARIEENEFLTSFTEIQIDCDWTPSIKEKYFLLLKSIRETPEMEGRKLSCTIRLHQLVDQRTGIPLVEAGMLMPYNLLPAHVFGTADAIMDQKTLQTYLNKSKPYPIPLDIGLPIFSWAAHFDMDKKFIGLIKDVTIQEIKKNRSFKRTDKRLYTAIEDSYINDVRILKGDHIRLDGPTYKELVSSVKYIAKMKKRISKNNNPTITFFHYSQKTVNSATGGHPNRLGKIFQILE